jgi:hypothetical protein
MNVYQYHQLSHGKQLDTLERSGVLLAERDRSFYHIKLYQLENFYVEVYYHSHFNVVVNINPFTNLDCLEPYLQQIDVDALLYV